MKYFTARYAGSCRGCGGAIEAGSQIAWGGRGRTFHKSCAPSGNRRADSQYWQGRAEGERYSSDRKFYGEALAEAWAMDAEMAAFNRGDD